MAILISAAFITSSISAVLGMGGEIILLGIMALIIPEGYLVVALHGVVQLISNITRCFVFRHHLRSDIIYQFLPGAVLGLSLSALIILAMISFFDVESAKDIKVDFLKPLIGIFILWFLFGKRHMIKTEQPSFFGVGAISGICTVFIGATGPLIAPFFLKGKLTKEKIIANKAICQAISHIGKMPIFILFFDFNYFSKMFVLVPMIIAVFVGANIGKQIIQIIPEIIFRALFKGTLTLIAFKVIAYEVFPLF